MSEPIQAARWAEGDFGEGYATYARVLNRWASVNGKDNMVHEIRWYVRSEAVIRALNEFVGDHEE